MSSVLDIQHDRSSAQAAEQQQHQQLQQQQHPAPTPINQKQLETSASQPLTSSTTAASGGDAGSNTKQHRWQWHKFSAWAKQFALDNFMLLSFSLAAALAMAWPVPGKAVASWAVGDVRVVQALNNFLVFLISGLTLKSDDFRALLKHWVGVLYGLIAILAITPCLGFAMLAIPFQPPEFATGLALFCVVPTTLGVGVALTAASKGNQALALLLTVATNLLGIVTVPYELRLVLSTGSVSTVSVEPGSLVVKLILTVLVPSVIGKLARDLFKPVQRFVTRFKTPLSLFSTLNLACIVWQTLSGARQTLLQQPFVAVLLVVVASSLLHVVMLLFNGLVVRYLLRLPFREAVAVVIMSSQKSAPVAVTVISYLTPSLTQQGLMAIPCILGQLAQIFIGSALAKWLRGRADKGL
uniref:Uncharacterized protein n=1 Tax=Tetradesmus obliquus TaxID=3088 RepID=A0A383W7R8_TETOB|eukprot:jgi/Sobl393_1/17991/SZX73034.1